MSKLTIKQMRALRQALAQTLLEHMDEVEDKIITDAQWATDDEEGPREYWTEEVERFLHKWLTKATIAAVFTITGKEKA